MSIAYIIPKPSMSRPNTIYDDDYDKNIVQTYQYLLLDVNVACVVEKKQNIIG
jgi:hypothetical protein